jgi:hypothetical protein
MIKENLENIRYEHRLTEDVDTLKAGITLHSLCSRDKLSQYSAWNGATFMTIPSDKVQIYKVTTSTIVEEVLVS